MSKAMLNGELGLPVFLFLSLLIFIVKQDNMTSLSENRLKKIIADEVKRTINEAMANANPAQAQPNLIQQYSDLVFKNLVASQAIEAYKKMMEQVVMEMRQINTSGQLNNEAANNAAKMAYERYNSQYGNSLGYVECPF